MHHCLEYDMRFISSKPRVSCVQEKGLPAKEIYLPRGKTGVLTSLGWGSVGGGNLRVIVAHFYKPAILKATL